MKIKGNTGVNIKTVGIFSLVVYVILFAIRLYQTFSITDGVTGYFTQNNFTVMLMYILVIGSVVAVCALCYISSVLPKGELNKKFSGIYVVGGVLFAASLLYDAFKNINVIRTMGSIAEAKESIGGTLGLVATVFALFGAVVIIVEAVACVKGKGISEKLSIPLLFPVIWAFCETLSFFSITVSYIKVSQLLFTIFFVAFLMVFLFENARVCSGIGRKNAMWFFYASGIVTVGLSLAGAVPVLIATFAAPEKIVSYCTFEPYALGGGIYALASMLARTGKKDDVMDSTTENQEISEI